MLKTLLRFRRPKKIEKQLLDRFWTMARETSDSALRRRTEGFVLGALTKLGAEELSKECQKILFPTEEEPFVIPSRTNVELYCPDFHNLYLCIPAHKAPHGFVDRTQPIKGVWMCGTHSSKISFGNCRGHKFIGEDAEFCRFFGECGECTLAGRPTTDEEIRGET